MNESGTVKEQPVAMHKKENSPSSRIFDATYIDQQSEQKTCPHSSARVLDDSLQQIGHSKNIWETALANDRGDLAAIVESRVERRVDLVGEYGGERERAGEGD
jgi:hypothetical protein